MTDDLRRLAEAGSGDEKETAWRKWREAREKEGWDFGSGHEASFYQDAFDAGWEARDDILRSALSDTAGPEMVLVHEDYCGYPDDCNCVKYRPAETGDDQ